MNTSTTNATLAEIDEFAKRYSKARADLSAEVAELEEAISILQRQRIGKIKRLAAVASTYGSELRSVIERSPALFVRPRTFALHGITVGFKKGSGKIDWDDDATVVARIEKFFPEKADTLLIVKKKPSAEGLETLDAKELAKVGARMEGTGDTVIVKSADSDIDKLVKKMLSEGATKVEG